MNFERTTSQQTKCLNRQYYCSNHVGRGGRKGVWVEGSHCADFGGEWCFAQDKGLFLLNDKFSIDKVSVW